MRKKIMSFILTVSMLFLFTMPAFAAESSVAEPANVVTDDEAVQAAYDAYLEFTAAMENADLDALLTALETFEAAAEVLSDEQQEELAALDDAFYDNLFSAAFISGIAVIHDAYVADPNVKTAVDFVDTYEVYVASDEEFASLMHAMIPELEEDYNQALTDMPSDSVLSIYNAYIELAYGLFNGWGEDLDAGIAAFEAVIDVFNELTEEELDELALLLEEEDGETAWSLIFSDYVNANTLNNVEDVYNAYAEDPTKETATAFVDLYDGIFNDPSYDDPALRELVRELYPDIDDVYEDAKAFLTETEAPDTGDFAAAMPLVALCASAATAFLSSRRKKA